MIMPLQRMVPCLLGIVLLVIAGGCARSPNERFEQQAVKIASVQDAVRMFGEPDATVVQGDGKTRRSWIISQQIVTPPRTVYLLFPAENSYPSDRIRVIPGRTDQSYCFFYIVTGDDNTIEEMVWQGNACDRMLARNLYTQYGRKLNSLPEKKNVIAVE